MTGNNASNHLKNVEAFCSNAGADVNIAESDVGDQSSFGPVQQEKDHGKLVKILIECRSGCESYQ